MINQHDGAFREAAQEHNSRPAETRAAYRAQLLETWGDDFYALWRRRLTALGLELKDG